MDFAKEILDAIEIIVKKVIDDNSTKIYTGVCYSIGKNNTCEMNINGKANTVKYYGTTPKINGIYRVFIPSNNMSDAFILVAGEGATD